MLLYHANRNGTWLQSGEYIAADRATVIIACAASVLYVFTAGWVTYLFVKRILDAANAAHDDEQEEIVLNEAQKKLIESIARYVCLFSIATLTSALTIIVLSGAKWWPENDKHHGQSYFIISGLNTCKCDLFIFTI